VTVPGTPVRSPLPTHDAASVRRNLIDAFDQAAMAAGNDTPTADTGATTPPGRPSASAAITPGAPTRRGRDAADADAAGAADDDAVAEDDPTTVCRNLGGAFDKAAAVIAAIGQPGSVPVTPVTPVAYGSLLNDAVPGAPSKGNNNNNNNRKPPVCRCLFGHAY
jgi:hypothetical protein